MPLYWFRHPPRGILPPPPLSHAIADNDVDGQFSELGGNIVVGLMVSHHVWPYRASGSVCFLLSEPQIWTIGPSPQHDVED